MPKKSQPRRRKTSNPPRSASTVAKRRARKPSRSASPSAPSSRKRAPKRTTEKSSSARPATKAAETIPKRRAVIPSGPAQTDPYRLNIADWVAGLAPERDPYARKLQLPKLPNGKQLGSGMAMDDADNGPFPYQGYFGLNSFNLYFPGYPYLAMLAQRTEYLQPTHTHAKDMTREWIEFTTKGKANKAKKIEEIETRFEELGVQALFRKALIHDGFYGVGHIFIDLKGHDDTKLPILLDPRSIKKNSLRGFRNIEPMWVTPVMWNSSKVELPSFYVPETWWALEREMHKSRLLQVLSREVPDILKPAYNFGGLSLSQLIEPYVDRWLKTVAGVNRLINNFSLIVLKTNMTAVLQDGDSGADLLKRLKMARMHGDNTGVFALDMKTEELENIQVSLSELAALQQQALEHMAYPTHEPLVVLTGVTPSGLNASSDGEIEVYHDWNRSEQNAVVKPVLKHILDVVQLDMYGKIDPDIGFKFRPIKQITGQVLAEIKKTQAEQDIAYIDGGVVDASEVREKVARDPDSGYTNLDIDRMPKPLDGGPGGPDDEPKEVGGTVSRRGAAKKKGAKMIGGKPAGIFVREAA
jgi:phage-related protein (TIGR01555 family)